MSDNDRGAYTPPSDPFAFHPRAPVRSGPAPVTLIASAVVLVAAIGAVYFVYKGGIRHRGEPPASVGTSVAEIKTPAPPPPANAAPAGLVVEHAEAGAPAALAAPTFAPPPESPAPLPPAEAATGPPTATTAPAPQTAPLAPAARSPEPGAKASPQPLTIARLADEALRNRAAPAAAAPPATATSAPVVQVGAFSSAALADAGWRDAARLAAGAMSGKGKQVEAAERDGRSFYRTYVTGFSSRAEAESFCGRLKDVGHACFVK